MNHAEVHSYMADYLEGDLDLTKRALLDAHLDGCTDCSREFGEMRDTVGVLRGLPSPEPPPFFVENVMRRVREGEGELRFLDRVREWASSLATAQVAVPATALVVGLLMASGTLDPSGFVVSTETKPAVQIARQTPRPPQLQVNARPPAVARAPRVTITLPPTPLAANDSNPPPFFTRRSTRSIRALPQPVAGSGLSTNVASRVGPELLAAQGSAFTTAGSDGVSQEERRARELDERLDRMIHEPFAFASEFESYSVAEQEIWLAALAERARETGRTGEALAELRQTGDRSAKKLATAFSVELKRLQAVEAR